MTSPQPYTGQTVEMLAWLVAEPDDDCLKDLQALRGYLALLADTGIPVAELRRCLDGIDARLLDITDRFKPHLLGAAFPLPHDLQRAVGELVATLQDVSGRFLLQIDSEDEASWFGGQGGHKRELASRALELLSEAYQLVCMGGGSVPAGLWKLAYTLMTATGRVDSAPEIRAEVAREAEGASLFKRLVAVYSLQPEGFTARELAWVFDYLVPISGLAELSRRMMQPDSAVTWIDAARDGPPVAQVRREAPAGESVFYFRALGLARRAGEQINWLEERIAKAEAEGRACDGELFEPEESGLPLGLTPGEVLSLLRRMRDRWTIPPSREQPRRRQIYAVQVCQGLRAIWDAHHGSERPAKVSRWRVYSESPGGYAIISVSGVTGQLTAGMAIGLRRDASQPWSICIVRWIRSEKPDEIELGLQVVASSCTAVSIGFRDANVSETTQALMLPPMPSMRRNGAILAPAGTYASRRLLIVRDGAPLYVVQARVLSLDIQTSCVELFQYEVDPYPG
jgi:hypothetical protein